MLMVSPLTVPAIIAVICNTLRSTPDLGSLPVFDRISVRRQIFLRLSWVGYRARRAPLHPLHRAAIAPRHTCLRNSAIHFSN
jgi:hypothetical protein